MVIDHWTRRAKRQRPTSHGIEPTRIRYFHRKRLPSRTTTRIEKMIAMPIDEQHAKEFIRISFGRDTTEHSVRQLADQLKAKLR